MNTQKPAIAVQGLSKLYRLDHEGRHDSLRAALMAMVKSPLTRFRQMRGTDASLEEFWALRDVTFDVMPGEVVGVIGRNGAGKSTLLKILSRIVEPSAGRAVMRGRVASLLEVGTGFHPELTGRENIFLNGSILGMRRREIESKFDEIVAFAEVEKFLDTPVKRYSSGMYVRLAFAVAAHLEPEVLIVDEVLAVGDTQFQQKCIGKLKDIAGSGARTVVFVSHDMGAVRALCNSCIYLAEGTVAAKGDVESVISAYLRPSVASARSAVVSRHGIELFSAGVFSARTDEPIDIVYFMEACEFRVRIGSNSEFVMAAVVVQIFNEYGALVSSLNTYKEGVNTFTMGPMHEIAFQVSQMQLMPGVYSASVHVYRPHSDKKYLEADNFFSFEVLPAVIPGGFLPYRKGHGMTRIVDGCTMRVGVDA